MPAPLTRPQRTALDAFLAGVERRALRMAEFATRDREEALDIVQDSMLRFVGRYRDRASSEWAPLFYRVLENRIFDWHRRRRVRWWLQLFGGEDDEADPAAAQPANAASDPLHALQRGNSMDRLQRAVQSLPLRQQQVFLLRVWEGLDVVATARAVGVSKGSVKTHLSRALARLRHELGEEWP
jgi:RNA polymerase sigma-70 factor (ECF subfamily)